MEGSIVSLRLKDFVTFYEATLRPNNRLNLITGPNGSGKSSIMCALCLGLAGKPKVVGRAASVSEYIRYNAEKAFVEIELYNPHGRNHVVSRTIFRDNKSTWMIGGFPCAQKEVENLVLKLNIQIDNLCQFLPQDRVQDFAKMNALTLMENTEKCIGGLEMWENHLKLKTLGAAYLSNLKSLQSKKENLANEEQIFSGLQAAVEKISSKRALVTKIEGLKEKQAYLTYESSCGDVKLAQESVQRKTSAMKALLKQSKPMEENLAKAKMKLKACEDKLRSVSSVFSKHHTSSEADFEEPEAIHDKYKEHICDCDRNLANLKKRLTKLKDMKLQREYLENLHKGMNEEGLQEKESVLSVEEKQKMNEICKLQMEKQSVDMKVLNLENQIKLLEKEMAKAHDVSNLKLQQLKAKNLYDAIMWFRKNKDKLRGKAYEPMCMVINMKNSNMAKYLECVVSHRDLLAFVCEDPDDTTFLMEELRDKLHYKVNIITSKPNIVMSSFTRPYELHSLTKYGFYTFLSDTFSAPEAIMRYLFKSYYVHRIPIGNDVTFAKAHEVPREIRVFMTADQKFSIRTSKFAKQDLSSSFHIREPYLLKASVNEDNIREYTARSAECKKELKNLKNILSSLDAKEDKLEESVQIIKNERSETRATLAKISSLKSRLRTLIRNEEEIKASECNEEDVRKKLVVENQICIQQMIAALGKNIAHQKKFGDIIIMMKLTQNEVHKARNDVSVTENELRGVTKKLREAEKEEKAAQDMLTEFKSRTLRYLKQFEELAKVKYKSKEFHNLLKKFDEFPDSLDDIQKEIHITQTKAELLGHSDSNVVLEYERRQTTINAIRKVIEQSETDIGKAKEEIEALKSKWLPFVNDLVKRMDKTFGDLLSRINYVGEIGLVKGENDYDFANYGFKIQVKFRQEGGLQELNQFRQSGGERAVAIAVYLMSLQELTSVPFRCVDEINQGMDEFHEAAVFTLLSDIVSKAEGAQYFLFTPKVLRTLTFTDSLLYTCVINGEVENITVDCKKIIKYRKAKESKKSSWN